MVDVVQDSKTKILRFICELTGETFSVPVYSALGQYEGDRLTAGVIYHNHMGHDIGASIGVAPGSTLSRRFVFSMFHVPFYMLGANRITARIRESNTRSAQLVYRLGFRLEGTVRQGYKDGEDMLLFGMLKQECRWLRLAKRYGMEADPCLN